MPAKIFTTLLSLYVSLIAIGQEQEMQSYQNGFYIKQFSEASGLVNNSCKYIFQDSRGFLWIGTFNGLSCFDGKQFVNYGVKEGLPAPDITQISEDSSGLIYIGTTAGIARYTGYHKSSNVCFYTYPQTVGLTDDIEGMQAIDSNTIIFQLTSGDINLLAKNRLSQLTINENGCGLVIRRDGNRYFYVFVRDTLRVFDRRFKNVKNFFYDQSSYSAEYTDSNGGLHLFSRGKTQRIKDGRIMFEAAAPDSLKRCDGSDTLNAMFYDQNDVIYSYDGRASAVILDMKKISSLTNCLIQAKDGTIWVSSSSIGLLRITALPYKIIESNEGVSFHYKKGRRTIYSNESFCKFASFTKTRDSLRHITSAILIDQESNAWFCTRKGLFKQPLNGKCQAYVFTGNKADWNDKAAEISNGVELANGDLWFYGLAGAILYKNNKFRYYTPRNGLTEDGGAVIRIIEDKSGDVLLQNLAKQLFYVEGDTMLPVHNATGTGDVHTNALATDNMGNTWFEYNRTIFRLEKQEHGKFVITDSIKPSEFNAAEIKTFNFDGQGNCWVCYAGGNMQVFFLNKDGHYEYTNSITYAKDDGLGLLGISSNALYPDDNGNMLLVPKPREVNRWLFSFSIEKAIKGKQSQLPTVSIVGIEINHKRSDQLLHGNLATSLDITDFVRLPHYENNIAFDYKSNALSHQSDIVYKIMLSGFDKEWRVTNLASVSYTNLPEGTYTFMVQAANLKGTWGPPVKYHFTINPPWYKTWWATMLWIVLCVVFIYTIFLIRLNNVRLHHLKENSLFKSSLIGLIGHDMVTPLLYIAKVSRQLRNYGEKLSRQTTMDSLGEIDATATKLHFFGESIVHWIKIQNDGFKPVEEGFDISKSIKELADFHHPLAVEKGNTLICEVDDDLYGYQDPTLVRIILHNLLLNANKFTSKGKIDVSANTENDWLTISVEDNGKGMDENKVNSLNNFHAIQSSPGTNKEKGWGMGYKVIIDLLRFSGGKLNVRSKLNEGTIVIVKLPCGETKFFSDEPNKFTGEIRNFKN